MKAELNKDEGYKLMCAAFEVYNEQGYAAFTVSYTHIDSVKEYIRTQEEHHRQTDFVEELKRLLEKNGVEYKPEYLV